MTVTMTMTLTMTVTVTVTMTVTMTVALYFLLSKSENLLFDSITLCEVRIYGMYASALTILSFEIDAEIA